MPKPAIYACPSCSAIVSNKGSDSDELTCPKCAHEFNPQAQVKAVLPPSQAKPEKKSSTSVTRNVIKNRPIHDSQNLTKTVSTPSKKPIVAAPPSDHTIPSENGEPKLRQRRKKKRKENNKAFYKILALWIFLFTCLVIIVNNVNFSELNEETAAPEEDEATRIKNARDREFLKRHASSAMNVLSKYMKTLANEKRLEFIDHSIKLSTDFSSHYQYNTSESWDGSPKISASNVLETPAGLSIEFLITDEGGKTLEANVLWDGRSWKIDWEQLARYSESDWVLFANKRGKKESYFRCFARLVDTNTPDLVKIKIYRPWPHGAELDDDILNNYALPIIELPAKDPIAVSFLSYWQKYLDGNLYDSILDDHDPDGFMRLNALLSWNFDDPNQPLLEIKDIKANHWLGTRILEAEQQQSETTDNFTPEE